MRALEKIKQGRRGRGGWRGRAGLFAKEVTFDLRPKKVNEGAVDVQEKDTGHCRAEALRQCVLGVFQKQGGAGCVDNMAECRAVCHCVSVFTCLF